MRLYYNDLSADCSTKESILGSLVECFKKIMKMLNISIFSFIILNLVKEGILDPSEKVFLTALSYLRDPLRYKQFLVPFIDSSSRPEEFLKISQNQL